MAKMTRREFTVASAAAIGATTQAAQAQEARQRPRSANERVRLGVIGIGNRGGQLMDAAMKHKDAQIIALCDVYELYLDKWKAKIGGGVQTYKDFRQLLENKDVDAVVIATPDHWHAIPFLQACEAGKDVYAEKPLSLTIVEGRRMVEAAKRAGNVVQVGLQRRSWPLYAKLRDMIKAGELGKVTVARAYRLTNMAPDGIGLAPDGDPPPGLDWDMWLGPAPKRAFNPNIAPYKFRWWKTYSSQMANWGTHYFDAIRWLLGESAPESVSAHGGKFAVNDARDIPDTLETIYEFASGRLLIFGQYEASGANALAQGEVELRGTLGTAYISGSKLEIFPEKGGQFQKSEPRRQPLVLQNAPDENGNDHVHNFIDCVKSRQTPNCPIEEGHLSTVFAHLGNIALATKSRLKWDAENERIVGNSAANNLLHYKYRAPWKL